LASFAFFIAVFEFSSAVVGIFFLFSEECFSRFQRSENVWVIELSSQLTFLSHLGIYSWRQLAPFVNGCIKSDNEGGWPPAHRAKYLHSKTRLVQVTGHTKQQNGEDVAVLTLKQFLSTLCDQSLFAPVS